MDKFGVRFQGNGTRDSQPLNASYIAQNAYEKPCPRTEQQVPRSSRNEHKLSPPRPVFLNLFHAAAYFRKPQIFAAH